MIFFIKDEETLDEETLEELSTMEDDKILFKAADKNLDNKLSSEEFYTFTNPNIGMMYPVLFTALAAKDQNKDGRISVQELISNCESSKSNDWKAYEKKRFNEDLEIDKNGFLTQSEILAWLMPENIQWDILLFFSVFLKGAFFYYGCIGCEILKGGIRV